MVTTNEIEVVDILLHLPDIISESEYHNSPLPFSWGHRRKRSKIPTKTPSPSSPPPALQVAEAPRPTTHLSFSPTNESDDNLTLPRRRCISLKRKRGHYLKIVNELTKDNDLLQGEIKNVKSYFDKLKDFNLKLKAIKHELSVGPNLKQEDLACEQPKLQFPGTTHHLSLIHNQAIGAPQISGGEGVSEFKKQNEIQQRQCIGLDQPKQ